MESRYIAFTIPGFLLLIVIELLVQRAQGEVRYRFHDSITNMSCGVGSLLMDFAVRGVVAFGYLAVLSHARLFHIGMHSVWAWIVAAVLLDFSYYFFHRAGHRINAIWAMHAVHHQSEQYNLSAALRQSWFDPMIEWLMYLPLAVIGFPLEMYLVTVTANRLYQFWIHTRSVGRLGPLEWVLNTPSHHRVHHGIDPKYIDRNYGGIFIVWDRLFGTFQAEEEEPAYGTVKPLASWNAAWANLAEWSRLVELGRGARTWGERLSVLFRPPEWRPAAMGGAAVVPPVDHETRKLYDVTLPRALNGYVVVNFAAAITATILLMYEAPVIAFDGAVAGAVAIGASVIGWGALLQSRPWALAWEWGRLAAMASALVWFAKRGSIPPWLAGIGVTAAAVLAAWVTASARYATNDSTTSLQRS
jgi:sterol desaturase/sphingolipid hydroxylase (fatty acid hydroxylase superfamily)